MPCNCSIDDIGFLDESLELPEIIEILATGGGGSNAILLWSSANFYRIESNTNIVINIPQGIETISSTLWVSDGFYLPINAFTTTEEIAEITYPNNQYALINADLKFIYDIFIQFSLSKDDGTCFCNLRQLRLEIVDNDGIIISPTMFANHQMNCGCSQETLHFRSLYNHAINDISKLKFIIKQQACVGTDNGISDSKLIITRITWTFLGLKNEE